MTPVDSINISEINENRYKFVAKRGGWGGNQEKGWARQLKRFGVLVWNYNTEYSLRVECNGSCLVNGFLSMVYLVTFVDTEKEIDLWSCFIEEKYHTKQRNEL